MLRSINGTMVLVLMSKCIVKFYEWFNSFRCVTRFITLSVVQRSSNTQQYKPVDNAHNIYIECITFKM